MPWTCLVLFISVIRATLTPGAAGLTEASRAEGCCPVAGSPWGPGLTWEQVGESLLHRPGQRGAGASLGRGHLALSLALALTLL